MSAAFVFEITVTMNYYQQLYEALCVKTFGIKRQFMESDERNAVLSELYYVVSNERTPSRVNAPR